VLLASRTNRAPVTKAACARSGCWPRKGPPLLLDAVCLCNPEQSLARLFTFPAAGLAAMLCVRCRAGAAGEGCLTLGTLRLRFSLPWRLPHLVANECNDGSN
jgi:hypothetical protein